MSETILAGLAPANNQESRIMAREILGRDLSLVEAFTGGFSVGIDYSESQILFDLNPEFGSGRTLRIDNPISEEEYKDSSYWRPRVGYYEGMTVRGAENLAKTYDRKRANLLAASYTRGAGEKTLFFIGALLGSASYSPTTYMTFGSAAIVRGVANAAMIARLTRTAKMLDRASRLLRTRTVVGGAITAGLTNTVYEAVVSPLWIARDAMLGDNTTLNDFAVQVAFAAGIGGAIGATTGYFGRAGRYWKNLSYEKRVAALAMAVDQMSEGIYPHTAMIIGGEVNAADLIRNVVRGEPMDVDTLLYLKRVINLTNEEYVLLPERIKEIVAGNADGSKLDNRISRYLSISPDAREAMQGMIRKMANTQYNRDFIEAYRDGSVNEYKGKLIRLFQAAVLEDEANIIALTKSLERMKVEAVRLQKAGKIKELAELGKKMEAVKSQKAGKIKELAELGKKMKAVKLKKVGKTKELAELGKKMKAVRSQKAGKIKELAELDKKVEAVKSQKVGKTKELAELDKKMKEQEYQLRKSIIDFENKRDAISYMKEDILIDNLGYNLDNTPLPQNIHDDPPLDLEKLDQPIQNEEEFIINSNKNLQKLKEKGALTKEQLDDVKNTDRRAKGLDNTADKMTGFVNCVKSRS